jgi:hypothetical protein
MRQLIAFIFLFAIFLAACASIPSGSGISTPIEMTAMVSTVIPDMEGTEVPFSTPGLPTLIPTISSGLSPAELKYRVLDEFPDFFFCDPDFYPIAREDEMVLAQQRFPELQANQAEFMAILNRTELNGLTTFTDEQKLLLYREHKKLNAIHFELVGAAYQFQIQTGPEGGQGAIITAVIDGDGSIDVLQQDPGFPTCPICLAAGTRIDTPHGAVAVENLSIGDQVWTSNEAGERVSAPILKIGSVKVPASHQIIHVILSDERELWASPGHPTADGRKLGDLKSGDFLDGAYVSLTELLPYTGSATYDLLPDGKTGFYWANGILMGSTFSTEK